ncbi:MAG TPA: PASTA domain-containing protein [Gaiellaceae bacterium]
MNPRRFRLTTAALFVAGLVMGGLIATPTASAAITGSNITTPTNNTFLSRDFDAASQTIAVSGTTSGGTPGTDMVDIRCYTATSSSLITANVPTNPDGTFSVPSADLHSSVSDGLCQLKAVPAGTTPADVTPFTGPTIGVGERDTSKVGSGPNTGLAYDYYIWAEQLTAAFDYVSLGGCGAYDGYLFNGLALTTTTFYCNFGFFRGEQSSPTRSEVQVDGANAYPPDQAQGINDQAASGLPAVTYSYSADAATGNLTIHESDPLVKCPDPTYPPTTTTCATFVSTGVTDNVTITQDHNGHVSWFSEAFTSTDGQAHTLDLLWDNAQHFYGPAGDASQIEYEWPGQSSFSMPTTVVPDPAATVSLPASAPGTILARMHGAADGDVNFGQGAIVYDRPATAASFTFLNTSESEFILHQTGTVPAGGSTRYRFALVQDYLAANVASMAQAAAASFLNTLSVSKAGNGSGTVTSAPGGISCGSTCSAGYGYGTSVTLTAAPSTGSAFTGWSGACSGTGACTVTTNDVASVTATFNLIPEKLSVSKKGDGKGKVTTYPAGLSCATGTCSRFFDYGTPLILRAKAAKGSSFAGWSGACKGTRACALLMRSPKSVKATFLKNCTVPQLKGKSLKAAKRLLKSHDCGLGKIRHAFSRTVRRGSVISQKPKAGRHYKHGTKVNLVLSG